MRIQLNEKASRVVEKLKSENSERRINKETWSLIVSEAILSIPQTVWKEQIARYTPDSFLLERAMKDPKLTRQLAEFLKTKMTDLSPE